MTVGAAGEVRGLFFHKVSLCRVLVSVHLTDLVASLPWELQALVTLSASYVALILASLCHSSHGSFRTLWCLLCRTDWHSQRVLQLRLLGLLPCRAHHGSTYMGASKPTFTQNFTIFFESAVVPDNL